jgi:hypothetical protein
MTPPETPATPRPAIDGKVAENVEGFSVDVSGEEADDRRLAEIETAGEEAALGLGAASLPRLSPDVSGITSRASR